MTWNPGFSRWMPAGTAAYSRENLNRLKSGLPISDVWIKNSKVYQDRYL